MFVCDYRIVMKWKNTRIYKGVDQNGTCKSEENLFLIYPDEIMKLKSIANL